MDSMIYLTGSRMSGLVDDLDVVATNLANANTAGFKATQGRFGAVLAALGPQAVGQPAGGAAPTWPQFGELQVDLSQGPIRRTDRQLDLAISGSGFFVVDTPAGQRYTRKGRFYLSAEGDVTDGAGNTVGTEGGALRVPQGVRDLAVDRNGQVVADEQAIGRIRLVDIPEPQALVSEGWTNFRNDGRAATPAAASEIIQGAVEESNVNPVREMVVLITVLRAYEASAHIIKKVDAANGELIKAA
jgi:flagellar basal-body rod protein FlgF